jgi:magnesium chelatase family protein
MPIARVRSFAFSGIDAVPVEVQVQISNGLPAFLIVGLADKAVGEARAGPRGPYRNEPGAAAQADPDQSGAG